MACFHSLCHDGMHHPVEEGMRPQPSWFPESGLPSPYRQQMFIPQDGFAVQLWNKVMLISFTNSRQCHLWVSLKTCSVLMSLEASGVWVSYLCKLLLIYTPREWPALGLTSAVLGPVACHPCGHTQYLIRGSCGAPGHFSLP